METFEKRLKRYTDENDLEIFGWLTILMQNPYLHELHLAKVNRLYHCVYLFTHAIMQTVAENMFGLKGKDGTKFYLENFVDGATPDRQFSLISDDIHHVRNVIAHQGYSSAQHTVEYFCDEIPEGWKRDSNTVLINPRIYAEQFEKAFTTGAHVQKYCQLADEERTKRKYQYIRQWLQLKSNPISQEIKKLEACTKMSDIRIHEAVIRKMIYKEYGLA
jgi:hypothetical protein